MMHNAGLNYTTAQGHGLTWLFWPMRDKCIFSPTTNTYDVLQVKSVFSTLQSKACHLACLFVSAVRIAQMMDMGKRVHLQRTPGRSSKSGVGSDREDLDDWVYRILHLICWPERLVISCTFLWNILYYKHLSVYNYPTSRCMMSNNLSPIHTRANNILPNFSTSLGWHSFNQCYYKSSTLDHILLLIYRIIVEYKGHTCER